MSLFHYTLKPPEHCGFPVGEDGRKSVAWFWLTDSEYYIHLGDVTLFESSPESRRKYPDVSCYLDYYYVRFLEDFFDILPSVAAPIPPDLYARVTAPGEPDGLREKLYGGYAEIEAPTEEEEAIESAVNALLWAGRLDTGFLAHGVRCCFYRLGDALWIHHDFRAADEDGVPVWSAGCGSHEMRWPDFLCEVEDLLTRFFQDMDTQVENAVRMLRGCGACTRAYTAYEACFSKKTGNPLEAGIAALIEEHAQRKAHFWGVLRSVRENAAPPVDWDRIRESAAKFPSCVTQREIR